MKVDEVLKIELEGDNIKNFKSAMKKIHSDHAKAGFSNSSLNADELKLINDLSEKINK